LRPLSPMGRSSSSGPQGRSLGGRLRGRPRVRLAHHFLRSRLGVGNTSDARIPNQGSGADPGRWRRWLGHDGRRRDRPSGQDQRILNKEAENQPIGSGCTRRQKPIPPVLPECLADLLVARPRFPAWSWVGQADAGESGRVAEIGDLERSNPVTPHVARKLLNRWYAPLGQVAIPLSPQGLLLICQVEGVDDLAALPAVVAGWLRPQAWVSVVRDLT
jgi:hypothetical protein